MGATLHENGLPAVGEHHRAFADHLRDFGAAPQILADVRGKHRHADVAGADRRQTVSDPRAYAVRADDQIGGNRPLLCELQPPPSIRLGMDILEEVAPGDRAGGERVEQQLAQVAAVDLRSGVLVGLGSFLGVDAALRIQHVEGLGLPPRGLPEGLAQAGLVHRPLAGVLTQVQAAALRTRG